MGGALYGQERFKEGDRIRPLGPVTRGGTCRRQNASARLILCRSYLGPVAQIHPRRIYHLQRGFLTAKRDAADKGADYTYTAAGLLKTRTWARGITTTYQYDKGLLTLADYNDITPDVSIIYDAFGRRVTVTQTTQSQCGYTYDPASLALDTETIIHWDRQIV